MNWKRWLAALAAAAIGGVATTGTQWAAGGAPTSAKSVGISLGIGAALGAVKFLTSKESEDAAKPEPDPAPATPAK